MPTLREIQAANSTKSGNQARLDLNRFAPFAVKQAIVERNFEAAQEALANAIRGEPRFCVHCTHPTGYKPEAWAVRSWMEAAGAIGQTTNVILAVTARLGVADEQEAANLISQGRQMQQLAEDGVSDEEAIEDALEVLSVLLRRHPERRAAVMAKLGSYAEEVNGNS